MNAYFFKALLYLKERVAGVFGFVRRYGFKGCLQAANIWLSFFEAFSHIFVNVLQTFLEGHKKPVDLFKLPPELHKHGFFV